MKAENVTHLAREGEDTRALGLHRRTSRTPGYPEGLLPGSVAPAGPVTPPEMVGKENAGVTTGVHPFFVSASVGGVDARYNYRVVMEQRTFTACAA